MSAITFYIAAFVPPSLIYFLVKAFKYPQWIHPPQLLDYFSKNSRLLAEINGSEDIRNSLDEASANDELVKNYFRYMATARRRCLNWNKTDSLQHALVECDSLRQEIADIKQRETSSERFVSGGLAAVATFIFLGDIQGAQALFLSLVILVFTLFGFWRFREYQRNNFEIDCYLREIESAIRAGGGWVSFFFFDRSPTKYFASRTYFWALLLIGAYLLVIYSMADILGIPLSTHVEAVLRSAFENLAELFASLVVSVDLIEIPPP